MVAVTGTPGVGKSTFARLLAKKMNAKLVRLDRWVRERGIGGPAEDGVWEVDPKQMAREFSKVAWGDAVVEGSLSHYLPSKLLSAVVVLRLHPRLLEKRLRRRGYDREKIRQNVEAEAIDLILVESLERHGDLVYQLDLTGKRVEEAVEKFLRAFRRGKRVMERVDWLETLFRGGERVG
ncbi:MAG: AAA family ATPase [Candidatus Hadarchaeales archaeon]